MLNSKNKKVTASVLFLLAIAGIFILILKVSARRVVELPSVNSASETTAVEDAAEALKKHVPRDDTAIDLIVETYYDLTLYYGNYSEDHNIFALAGSLDYHEFFAPYFTIPLPDENKISPEYEAFRIAFFDPNSPAWTFEFPWRTGPGIGGEVVGRRFTDANTMLVYGRHGWQEHLGPALRLCKGGGDTVDKFTFKKNNGEWKIFQIEENIDSWTTNEGGDTEEECREINQDKIEKYR